MTKQELLVAIIAQLSHDLSVFFTAAKTAHAAATHEENAPDNKYDTLALEASYLAQGQANRAQELRQSLQTYQHLTLLPCNGIVRLTSLVTVETEDGSSKTVFIGPVEGGMKLQGAETEIMVITPTSPLGRELMGKNCGELAEISTTAGRIEYEIVDIE